MIEFKADFIELNLNSNILKIVFKNCKKTIRFLEDCPIPQVSDSLSLDPENVTLDFEYHAEGKALNLFNKFKNAIKLFSDDYSYQQSISLLTQYDLDNNLI